jgi:hypothetical protein
MLLPICRLILAIFIGSTSPHYLPDDCGVAEHRVVINAPSAYISMIASMLSGLGGVLVHIRTATAYMYEV